MHLFYNLIVPLLIGFCLDLLIGDPYKLPHPIRFFGYVIARVENHMNKGSNRKMKGVIAVLVLLLCTGGFLMLVFYIVKSCQPAYILLSSIFVFYGLANRSLINEVLKVEKALSQNGVEAGRKQVQMIVGRDTSQLSQQQIRTAALETLSENLSDGVIAPLFYFALGGVPAMFCYKMVNTLDSMVGYKNERYLQFGWFSAKLDDVLNFIPARITALLMVLVSLNAKAALFVLKYGNQHASPNSGYPEAALAGILDCRFGGPNVYHGTLVSKPYIGSNPRLLTRADILKSCAINGASSVLFVGIVVLLAYWFYVR